MNASPNTHSLSGSWAGCWSVAVVWTILAAAMLTSTVFAQPAVFREVKGKTASPAIAGEAELRARAMSVDTRWLASAETAGQERKRSDQGGECIDEAGGLDRDISREFVE